MRYTILWKDALYVMIPDSVRYFVTSKELLPIILAYNCTLAILPIRD
jgi:hypothetical protein